MAEYDFKAPINATVVIYDSDEDTNPSSEKGQNSNDVTKNIDVSEILEDINEAKNKTNHKINVPSAKRRLSENPNKMKKFKGVENVTRSGNTEFVFQNQVEIQNRNDAANILCNDKTIPREDQSTINNDQISTNNLQGSHEKHPLVCVSQIAFPQSQDNINIKANECLGTLLDTVSTHMIFIMKAYAKYVVITRKTSDRNVLEKARKHYLDAKSHFYYLSFSVVSNIMMPKENDPVFMHSFIDDTVKLAKARQLYFKHSDMMSLCADMFAWVKFHIQHPLLKKLLSKTSQSSTSTTNTKSCRGEQDFDKSNNATSKTCIFRDGPPGRELTINLSSTINQNTMQQFHNTNPGIPVPNVPWSRQNEQPPGNELRNYANTTYMQQFQAFHTRHYHPTTPPEVTSRPPPSYQLTQAWHNNAVTPQNYSQNQLINSSHYDSFQPDGQVEVNRSLSRDSGFMSPLSSVFNDPMVK